MWGWVTAAANTQKSVRQLRKQVWAQKYSKSLLLTNFFWVWVWFFCLMKPSFYLCWSKNKIKKSMHQHNSSSFSTSVQFNHIQTPIKAWDVRSKIYCFLRCWWLIKGAFPRTQSELVSSEYWMIWAAEAADCRRSGSIFGCDYSWPLLPRNSSEDLSSRSSHRRQEGRAGHESPLFTVEITKFYWRDIFTVFRKQKSDTLKSHNQS